MARSYVREARRGLGRRRDRIGPIIERLAAEHADAEIALRFRSDLELLVSVMLSAQTTDVNVNKVTPALFRKYRRPEDYLAVPVEELERDIYATGFFRQKAKAIRGTMRMLIEEYDGEVPRRLDELVRLPGVARKTANVVAAELGHAQGIVVDTHVRRLSQRLGLTRNEDPVKIERDLQRVVPRADWARFPHLLIWHGRRVCDARRPLCEACVIEDLCPVESHRGGTMDHAATMRRAYDLLNAGDIDGFGELLRRLRRTRGDTRSGTDTGRSHGLLQDVPDRLPGPADGSGGRARSGDKVVARVRAPARTRASSWGFRRRESASTCSWSTSSASPRRGAHEHWGVFDAMTMMQQLGVVPAPA